MPDPGSHGPVSPARRFGPAASRWWGKGAGIVLLLCGGAALSHYFVDITPMQLVAEGSVLMLGLFFLLRRARVRVFGPVLYYDLARHARRPRTYLGRVAYPAVLLVLLCLIVGSQSGGGDWFALPPEKMAGLAAVFFYTIFGV